MMFSTQAGGGMPEIGLLPFARVALDVATTVLPTYRSRFSKHQFTQPQLLAILCLMRYEDWTFREAEVRLREHRDLREVLQLQAVPDYTTLFRFLRRLDDDTIDRGLGETVRRLCGGRRRGRVSAAVDGTGLSPQAVSTYFLRRVEQHSGGKTRYKHYLKWLVIADVHRQILLAQRARQGPWIDTRALPGLVDAAAQHVPLRLVLADAEFDSEANHQHIRQRWGAQSIIPAQPRRGIPKGVLRRKMHEKFPQKRQALLLGLTYNLYRLRHPDHHEDVNRATLTIFRINTCEKQGGGGLELYTVSRPTSPACLESGLPIHTTLHRTALSGSSSRISSTACPRLSRKFPCSRKPRSVASTTRQGILVWFRSRLMIRLARFFAAIRRKRRPSGTGKLGISVLSGLG